MSLFDRFRSTGLTSAKQNTPTSLNDNLTDRELKATRRIEEGHALEAMGKLDEAMQCYQDAIRTAPNPARALLNSGNVMLLMGDLKGALNAFREALQHKPDYAGAYFNMGNALLNSGQYSEAIENYQKALEIKPDYAEVICSLGVAQKNIGKIADAITSFQTAIRIDPLLTEAKINLANILNELFIKANNMLNEGKLDLAVEKLHQVLMIEPNLAEAHATLGVAQQKYGRLDAALVSLNRALEIKPDSAEILNNHGIALQMLGQHGKAIESFRHALDINPDFVEANGNMASALNEVGRFEEALSLCRHALKLNPDFHVAHNNMGTSLAGLGRFDEALSSYQMALRIKPDFIEARSNLLFNLNYLTDQSPSYYLEQAHEYGRSVAGKVASRFSSWSSPASPVRLRVGIVTGDLRNHSVGKFLESTLANLDSTRIELFAYPTNLIADELTARVRPNFSSWKHLAGMSDSEAAESIHADGLHVLLDMSGHTLYNRLPVFAYKPAPVQVTWLALPNTTGITEMDYVLGDSQAIPPENETHLSETVWRLPDSYVCFSPPNFPIDVAPLPALSTKYITFGSFNNLTKMNDVVVKVWARILAATPNSRLYLKTTQLKNETVRERTRHRFEKMGITPDRLILSEPMGSIKEHLSEYNRVDIALDTFPYPGVTTSIEAMWMGVPVLSLLGNNFLSLSAKSIAHYSGLQDWVAIDEDDYVLKAVRYAENQNRLAELRSKLRQQVLASPLFDAPRFARNFENAMWEMWHIFQSNQNRT